MRSLGIPRTRSDKSTAGVVALGLMISQGITGIALLIFAFAYIGLLSKEPPPMVQLESGRAIAMEPMDSGTRAPATIQTFVRDTFTLLYSASGKLPAQPGKQGVADPGITVKTGQGERKISTVASLASWGLTDEDNFRAEFITKLAEGTPPEIFTSQGTEMALSIRYLSEPTPGAESGTWTVTLLAEQILRSSETPTAVAIPLNRVIHLRSITPPAVKTYSSDLERQIATVRQAGLVIEKIEPYRNDAPSGSAPQPTP